MKGYRTGVCKQILEMESCAVYLHSYGHAINWACQDTIHDIKDTHI